MQGHRFDIIEAYGCQPTTYFSIPAIFIVYLPPLVVAATAGVFAGIILIRDYRMHIELMIRQAFLYAISSNDASLLLHTFQLIPL